MQTEIIINREVSAVQIPSGDPFVLPAGTAVIITQTLGGSYTVATQSGLARISSEDADALGIDPNESPSAPSGADELPADASPEDRIWNQLKQVFDPEIPVDIVNLGLVYDCSLNEEDGTTERTRDKESTCSRLERTCTYYTDFRGRDAVSLSLLEREDMYILYRSSGKGCCVLIFLLVS